MNRFTKNALSLGIVLLAAHATARIVFYENNNFQGRSFTAETRIDSLNRYGFNDRASSIEVFSDRWEVCEDEHSSGRCIVLRPGHYPSLAAMGLNDRVSSARMLDAARHVEERGYAPMPQPVYDNRRRNNERLYEAQVTSVHAVVGPPQQRCWIEREPVVIERNNQLPGAIVGGLLGGILGHQIGGGFGKDIATVGGVVAGAAVGANVGRDSNGPSEVGSQNVQRCANVANPARTEFWDVTYSFRGESHRIQMTTPPSTSITVNWQGEPRS